MASQWALRFRRSQKGPPFRFGGVAFEGEGADFGGVVGGVLFGGGELELAGAAVLDVVVEGSEIGGGDFGGGLWGGGGACCAEGHEGAGFAALELGAGSRAAVPC